MKKKLLRDYSYLRLWITLVLMISVISSFAQKIEVTGIIKGMDGNFIPGATIVEKGTTNGTVSNVDGEFSFNVEPDATLVVSFVGMLKQEIPVGDQRRFEIALQVDAIGIEEVVAIGYGTRSKQALTGSIVNVNTSELKKINPVNNITNALQGMVPGVVANSGNTPGSGANIQIRGIGTINSTSPLVIVDGIPSDIGRLNPAEIESMSVLKDAASTAIYGARGANGVIVVTTIQGSKSQAPKVTVNARASVSALPPQYDMLNPTEFGEMLWMSYENSGMEPNHPLYGNGATPVIPKYIYPSVTNDIDLSNYSAYDYQIVESTPEGTNWFDYIYQNAITQDYDMTITGGADKLTYGVVFGYTDNLGSVKESGYDRFNFRTNLSMDLYDWLEIGENFGVRAQNDWGRQSDGGEGSSVSMAMLMPRLCPVYDIEGNWAPVTKLVGFSSNRNEPSEIWRQSDYTNKYLSLEGNVYANIRFLKNFTVKTILGVYAGNGWVNQPTEANPWNYSGTSIDKLTVSSSKARNWDWTNTLNYIKTFGDHRVDVMAGFEASSSRSDNMSASREEYFLQTEEYFVLSAGEGTQTNSGSYSESSSASYFGRLHYEYKDKYFFDGIVRHDGSSVFAENYRWGTFPSFAGGWIISNEEFMNSVDWMDLLKFRASWGQSGNNRIGTYNGFSTFQTNINYSYYPIDGSNDSPISGFETKAFGNRNAKWETTTTVNFGLDITVLEKFSLGLDLWNKKTSDMLYPKAIPAVYGYASAPSVNIGDMLNKGFDLSFDYKGKSSNNVFTYHINLVASRYKNELENLSDAEDEVNYGSIYRDQYYTYAKKGTSFPEFYGYEVLGIFQTDGEAEAYFPNELDPTYNKAGHFIFADINDDKVINSDDRTSIGNPHPDLTLGLNLNFTYKNFDLSAMFYSSIGNDVLNLDRRILDFNYMEFWRGTRRLYDSWGSPHLSNNADAKMPLAEINDQVSQLPSSYYVEDGSYLRLRNLQVGYTFSNTVINKIGLENLRLYVVAQNLVTITGYDGLDPAFYSSGINFGVDAGRWPTVKTYMFGINVTF
ncbi:SusC/RagA family TonB-linked outer membrane protein [Maribellus comscasis]|uniref:SusC/RagA family TonB-linked outer membrane protein n=1 Tax=Maribellus comscasis TaxID=2681766 RepID=A0A6I6JXL9_9BACT|nr:TonB-dependent receptor [Maribellus comscasis]QGY47825.1 SusC/RagA family TonB-linked outer membrane protein [Maribellus comscasis]